jgi:hypothetical protein
MGKTPESTPAWASVHEALRPEHLESVSDDVLGNIDSLPAASGKRLAALVRQLKIPGFRSALKAPRELVAPRLATVARRSPDLAFELVSVWSEIHVELGKAVATYLDKHPLPVAETDDAESPLPEWSLEQILLHADGFCAQHRGHDRQNVGLMMAWRTLMVAPSQQPDGPDRADAAPLADAEACPPGSSPEPIWAPWLRALRTLPADAPEWVKLEQFIEAVHTIASDKQREGEARAALSTALSALQSDTDALAYFEWADLHLWTPDAFPSGALRATADRLRELLACLATYRALREEQPATRAEELDQRRRADELVQQIEHLHRHLQGKLAPPSPDEVAASDPVEASPSGGEHLAGEDAEEPAEAPSEAPPTDTAEPDTAGPDTVGPDTVGPDTDADLDGSPLPPSGESLASEDLPTAEESFDAAALLVVPEAMEQPGPLQEPEPPSATPGQAAESTAQPAATVKAQSSPRGDEATASGTAEEAGHSDAVTDSLAEDGRAPSSSRWLREAALAVQADASQAGWDDLLWALLEADDLAGAYWLAESLSARGQEPPVPAWLLQALYGARWLTPGSDAFTSDLLELGERHDPPKDPALRGLAVAAALRTALIAPSAGLVGWLADLGWAEGLYDIATAVGTFAASVGVPVRTEYVQGAAGVGRIESRIASAAAEARAWLHEAAPKRTVKYRNANSVWLHLIGASGDLHRLLLPASDDDRKQARWVAEETARWRDQDYLRERVKPVDVQMAGAKYRPTTGAALKQLYRYVGEACDMAHAWSTLVLQHEGANERGDWLFGQVTALRSEVVAAAGSSFLRLMGDLQSDTAAQRAVAACLIRSLAQLCDLLQVPYADGLTQACDYPIAGAASNLAEALSARVQWLPELVLAPSGEPEGVDLPKVADALVAAAVDGRTAEAVVSRWLEKQDYRFTSSLISTMDEAAARDLAQRMEEAKQGSRAALVDVVDRTLSEIEQALVDGVIGEERISYVADVDGIDIDRVEDFAAEFRRLSEVRAALAARRQDRLNDLRKIWQDLAQRLRRDTGSQREMAEVARAVESALDAEDTAVVEEAIARLREFEDGTRGFPTELIADPRGRDVLSEFAESGPEIETWLEARSGLGALSNSITAGQTRGDMSFGGLASTRREEAARAVLEWQRLKRSRPDQKNVPAMVGILLRYLGFTLDSGSGASVREENRGSDWMYLRASMSASDLAKPIPQFGHQAEGRYHIVCFWERPGADTITARLSELRLGVHTVIVLYLGRLTARQRRDVSRVFRQQELSVAVLDETLLAFLAQEHDARLGPFLRCSLPYSALNPYTPFQAGDVPPEMFFGRSEMARYLQDPTGPCVVYGGRQLGKSALLRHVQRRFHNQSLEQYAWIENLQLTYDSREGGRPERVWIALRDQFIKHGLLSTKGRSDQPDAIRKLLRDSILGTEGRRVLAMFDEADELLDADAQADFPVVTGLRELMLETGRRFKVVFAGLHSVQRFQGIPNQPLAHFGSPICVGPLEAQAARDLVREPLAALGYRFENESVILRILSYTNYHPGLVQLFCQELLKEMLHKTDGQLPPYRITRQDVEMVYRRPDVRDSIRERFNWTLALDVRYQAIAWSLIVEQVEERDSYALPFAPGVIQRQVRSWWPAAFDGVHSDEFRGLLEEMVGLGVLARNADGHYRLRSPNLVRLMGTEQDVEDLLMELTAKEPPKPPDADNLHGRLDFETMAYSPLTYAQERALAAPRSGVGLICASQSSGLACFPAAFRRFLPTELTERMVLSELPTSVTGGDRLQRWIAHEKSRLDSAEQGVVYAVLAMRSSTALQEVIAEAIRYCRGRRQRERWLRMLFVLSPQATWAWLGSDEERRRTLERQADVVTQPRPWNASAIRQILSQHNMMHTDDICSAVREATGGWQVLVQELLSRSGRSDDPRGAADQIAAELHQPSSELRRSFVAGLGLDAAPRATGLIARIRPLGPRVPLEFLTPELIGDGKIPLTEGDCARIVGFLAYMGYASIHGDELAIDPLIGRVLDDQ